MFSKPVKPDVPAPTGSYASKYAKGVYPEPVISTTASAQSPAGSADPLASASASSSASAAASASAAPSSSGAGDPALAKELNKKGETLLNQGRFADARALAEQAVEADPTDAKGYMIWGSRSWSRGVTRMQKKIFSTPMCERGHQGPEERVSSVSLKTL